MRRMTKGRGNDVDMMQDGHHSQKSYKKYNKYTNGQECTRIIIQEFANKELHHH